MEECQKGRGPPEMGGDSPVGGPNHASPPVSINSRMHWAHKPDPSHSWLVF